MFQEWGFLITEMVLLIILAALLGVVVGRIIWGRAGGSARADDALTACRKDATAKDARIAELEGELEAARTEALAAEKAAMLAAEEAVPAAEAAAAQAHAEDDVKIHALESERDAARAEALTAEKTAMLAAEEAAPVAEAAAAQAHAEDDARIRALEAERDAARAEALAAEKAAMQAAAEVVPVAEAVAADHGAHPIKDYDGEGKLEGRDEGTKPATLSAPRAGGGDDLKQIKGVGPKLEQLCHALGFYHFDQIAAWTADEVAWVDANLKGFKGRVSRDGWVEQAKVLAAGGSTAFADRVKDGKVYE